MHTLHINEEYTRALRRLRPLHPGAVGPPGTVGEPSSGADFHPFAVGLPPHTARALGQVIALWEEKLNGVSTRQELILQRLRTTEKLLRSTDQEAFG